MSELLDKVHTEVARKASRSLFATTTGPISAWMRDFGNLGDPEIWHAALAAGPDAVRIRVMTF